MYYFTEMSIFAVTAVKSLVISASMALLLSGCGDSKPDDTLIKSCEQLNINLNSLRQAPNLYKVDDPSDKFSISTDNLYLITNSGNATRKRNKEIILREYSFLASELENSQSTFGQFDNIVELKILTEALKNTGFEINLTPSEIASIKGDFDDPSSDLVDAEIDRIMGIDLYDEQDEYIGNTGCKLVSSYKYNLHQKDSEKYPQNDELDDTDLLWTQAVDNVRWLYEVVALTNICQKDGNYLGNKCAQNDYVSKVDYDYSLPAPTLGDPWSRTWSSKQQEELAKTVWCINNGYRNYIYSKDICTNTLNR
jgi:hypothetical protein